MKGLEPHICIVYLLQFTVFLCSGSLCVRRLTVLSFSECRSDLLLVFSSCAPLSAGILHLVLFLLLLRSRPLVADDPPRLRDVGVDVKLRQNFFLDEKVGERLRICNGEVVDVETRRIHHFIFQGLTTNKSGGRGWTIMSSTNSRRGPTVILWLVGGSR